MKNALALKKPKKVSVSKLKAKAWKLFSEWVRRAGAAPDGFNICVTCGKAAHWKHLQAGHFIPGRHNSILFDERGCHPQDYHCNVGLKGNPRAYDRFMRLEYGVKVIRDLERLDRISKQFKPFELEEIIKDYTEKLKTL